VSLSDPLSVLLRDFRFSGVSYGQCELALPWGIQFEPENSARLHLVVEGETWLQSPSGAWEHLHEGDVVMLSRGPGHVLADCQGTRPIPLSEFERKRVADRVFNVRNSGGGRRAVIVCCSIAYDGAALKSLMEQMPDLIVLRANHDSGDLLQTLLRAMAEEVRRNRAGSATLLTRYADLIVGCIIREWAESAQPNLSGWLDAARDPQLGQAMLAIHSEPGDDWTVERLSARAGMSRSKFYAKFTSILGQTPARYVAGVRMNFATLMLQEERATIADAAARLGYESEASFSRAYKRTMGSRRVPFASSRAGKYVKFYSAPRSCSP